MHVLENSQGLGSPRIRICRFFLNDEYFTQGQKQGPLHCPWDLALHDLRPMT